MKPSPLPDSREGAKDITAYFRALKPRRSDGPPATTVDPNSCSFAAKTSPCDNLQFREVGVDTFSYRPGPILQGRDSHRTASDRPTSTGYVGETPRVQSWLDKPRGMGIWRSGRSILLRAPRHRAATFGISLHRAESCGNFDNLSRIGDA